MDQAALLSLPNLLSLSRLLLAGAFVATPNAGARAALVVAAALTDFFDGWLARRRDSATSWGALLDPIADRVFALVALATLLYEGAFTTGQFFILLARDIATAVGFLVARVVPWLRRVPFKARFPGKVVTVLQFAAVLAALVAPLFVGPLVIAVGIAAVWAIADYTLALWHSRER
ncbi:MAG TPA: CDP-alcohol phosphatidyltransferase family protein [Gemmatimonadaceae bacterium]|nr:CDP-alcohol phosphatidyltransferase family protein [Gemmatimonadaceae bacterium]